MGHNQLQTSVEILYKCFGRQEANEWHHICMQKPRAIWGYDQ